MLPVVARSAVIILMLMARLVVLATLIVETIAGIVIALLTSHSVLLTAGLQPGYGLILPTRIGATFAPRAGQGSDKMESETTLPPPPLQPAEPEQPVNAGLSSPMACDRGRTQQPGSPPHA